MPTFASLVAGDGVRPRGESGTGRSTSPADRLPSPRSRGIAGPRKRAGETAGARERGSWSGQVERCPDAANIARSGGRRHGQSVYLLPDKLATVPVAKTDYKINSSIGLAFEAFHPYLSDAGAIFFRRIRKHCFSCGRCDWIGSARHVASGCRDCTTLTAGSASFNAAAFNQYEKAGLTAGRCDQRASPGSLRCRTVLRVMGGSKPFPPRTAARSNQQKE
jgi:hypothetical protein